MRITDLSTVVTIAVIGKEARVDARSTARCCDCRNKARGEVGGERKSVRRINPQKGVDGAWSRKKGSTALCKEWKCAGWGAHILGTHGHAVPGFDAHRGRARPGGGGGVARAKAGNE